MGTPGAWCERKPPVYTHIQLLVNTFLDLMYCAAISKECEVHVCVTLADQVACMHSLHLYAARRRGKSSKEKEVA